MKLKLLVFASILIFSASGVLSAPTVPVVSIMPNGVTIATSVDPELRRITYSWDFSTLPGDYAQVDISAAGPPAVQWCATECVIGAGITEAVLSDANEAALQLKYEAVSTPPRINSVELTYNSGFVFTGEFIDGAPTTPDGNGNISVTYRSPPGGQQSMMWAFTPVLRAVVQPNRPPVANAGPAQTVTVGETVTLNGSASIDIDPGDVLSYSWTLDSPVNSASLLSDGTAVSPTLVPDVAGDYTATLVVNDGSVNSVPDTVVITAEVVVLNNPPVADAGPDQTVSVDQTVTLDGSASSDVDPGDVLSYSWQLSTPTGSASVLSDNMAVSPTFTADVAGLYTATLTVSDGSAESEPDSALISAEVVVLNNPPVADAGADQMVSTGETVTLNGDGSSDIDGDQFSYSWSLLSMPAGSAALLSTRGDVITTFEADIAGDYVAQLIVSDGVELGLPDTTMITASQVLMNTPPVADAGLDQTVFTGANVVLDGSGSSDADPGDALTYSWSFTVRPLGSLALLSAPTTVNAGFTADVAGTYVVQLIVSDGEVDSLPASTTIIVQNVPVNTPPVAHAGPDQLVSGGDAVILDGTGSSDPDNDTLTYNWSFIARPAGSLAVLDMANPGTPVFTADKSGIYVVQLIVSDGEFDSAPATVTIVADDGVPLGAGERLYSQNCSGCHGSDAHGGVVGVGVRDKDAEKIQDAISKLHESPFLSNLTPSDIRQIADYLDLLGEDSSSDDD